MSKNIAIKVSNLTKIYHLYDKPQDRLKEALNPFRKSYHKDFYALNNVSFEIKKGETVGIIGRNGSGKSTLLKVITGVLTPNSGHVQVNGKISAILELGAGFNGEMTGLENIYLNSTINGLSQQEIDNCIDDIIEFSELGDFIHQPVKTYSSGMNARLAFGIAIHVDPDILIVDEALSVGDAAFQRKCFSKMEEIRASGATILFVSHSEGSIVNLCSRAIWVSNGKQILDGAPKLVTGLYLKHANAKQVDKDQIINEYHRLEANPISNKKEKDITAKKAIKEFYNPELKPKSTIFYEERGAKITDVMVTTLDGKKINVLTHGKEYIYTYKINVKEKLNNVNFGFLIKRKDGIELGGGTFPSNNTSIDFIDNSQIITIKFLCSLNNGEYFLNAGCSAKVNGKVDYVHRILDAYMIKVIDSHDSTTGTINFVQSWEIKS